MDSKKRVLIIDGQEDWQKAFQAAFLPDEFELKAVSDPGDALEALKAQEYSLVVIDPAFEALPSFKEPSERLFTELSHHLPLIPVIIVTGDLAQFDLWKTLNGQIPVIHKDRWDSAAFDIIIKQSLDKELWGPPEPEIILPPGSRDDSTRMPTIGVTRYLSQTGATGPLTTGLQPPAIGTRVGKPRVLIVDSRPHWQHRIAELMDNEGYFWRVASNYDEANERLQVESFHIVLLDLMLNTKEIAENSGIGWRLLDNLMVNFPKTKVIIASGEGSRSDVARLFMRYPIKGFIDKDNFDEDELRRMIREQLGGPSLRIQTLGKFGIWRDGKAINAFGDDFAEKVIRILIARRGENVSVEELAECLWPGADPKAFYSKLANSINFARGALEPDLPRPNDSTFILRDGANYAFNMMANLEIDAEQLRRMVTEGHQSERKGEIAEAVKHYEQARLIYLGDYLPGDRFERWAIQERSTLQSLFTAAVNRLADLYSEQGKLEMAIEAANRSLQIDAYNENTYRRLMRYYTCKGDRSAALNVYRTLVKLFSEFFGEEPENATENLRRDIEDGKPVSCVEASSISGVWRLNSK